MSARVDAAQKALAALRSIEDFMASLDAIEVIAPGALNASAGGIASVIRSITNPALKGDDA